MQLMFGNGDRVGQGRPTQIGRGLEASVNKVQHLPFLRRVRDLCVQVARRQHRILRLRIEVGNPFQPQSQLTIIEAMKAHAATLAVESLNIKHQQFRQGDRLAQRGQT